MVALRDELYEAGDALLGAGETAPPVLELRVRLPRDESELFDDRLPAIPFYTGRPWFLPLVGAYYQVKDWIQ